MIAPFAPFRAGVIGTVYLYQDKVNAQPPPAFILCSQDDPISVDSSLQYMTALKNNRVPSTLHIYAGGGHGWGFKDSFVYKEQWTSELAAWLREINK